MKLFARAGSPVCPGKGKRKFWGDKGPRIGSDPSAGRYSPAPCWHGELRCPLRDVPICRETHGKPVLKDCTNLFFNISHSGDYAVCAVSKQPVGIDIERIGAYQPNVARRVCSDAEQKLLEQCEDPARLFYRLWTLKESYVKLTGTGISVPLSQITFSFLADGRVESNQNRVQFASFPFGDGYWLAVGEKMR